MAKKIDIEKVSEAIVDEYCSDYGLDVGKKKLPGKVAALQKFIKESTEDQSKLLVCDTCGGESESSMSRCPFCGDGEVKGVSQPTGSESEVEDDADAYGEEGEQTPPSRPRRSQAGKGKGKGEVVEATGVEVVQAEAGSVAKLDDGIRDVKRLFVEGACKVWELGQAIAKLYETELWKHRLGDSGKQAYKSWAAFVRSELNMHPSYAFQVMDVAKNFTHEQIAELGIAKLGFVLKLPEGERAGMLERAKDGMPLTQVSKEVRNRLTTSGHKRNTGRTRGPSASAAKKGNIAANAKKAAAKSAPAASKDGEVVAVSQLGRTTIKLYAAPNSKEKKEGVKVSKRRATTLAQEPSGVETSVNGVVVRYRIVKQAQGLALVIERRREE